MQAVINGLGPSVFVGVLDTAGRLLHVNQSALDSIGATPEQVHGKPFPETPWWNFSLESVQHLQGMIERAAAGEAVHFEHRFHDRRVWRG